MNLHKLATLISYIFFPMWLLPVSIYLLLNQIDPTAAGVVMTLMIILVLLPVMTLLLLLIRSGIIKNLDIHERQNRNVINFMALFCGTLLLLLLRDWGLTEQFIIFLIFFLAAAVLALVTLFWKISVHTASITLFSLILVNYLGKFQIIPLVLIPVVAWARVYRKNHTLSEVLGGIVLSSVIIYLVITLQII